MKKLEITSELTDDGNSTLYKMFLKDRIFAQRAVENTEGTIKEKYDEIVTLFQNAANENQAKRFLKVKSFLDGLKTYSDKDECYFDADRDAWKREMNEDIPDEMDPVIPFESVLEVALDNIKEI